MDINKLKVADLRKELQSRGLDSKGNKPVLVERLREAIEKEDAEEEESENEESSSVEENSVAYETAESANTTTQDMPTASEEKAFSITATENNVEETELLDPSNNEANETAKSEYLGENNATCEKSPESSPEPEKEEPIPSIEEETSLQEMETIEEPVENSPEPDVEPEPELEPEPEPELESEPEPEHEPEPEPEPITEKVEESTIETQTNGHDDYQTLNEPEKIEEIEPIEKVDAEPATEIENIESIANEEPVVEEIEENGQQAKIQDQPVADEFDPSFEENEKPSPFPEQDEKMETDVIEDKPAEETPADEECLWNSDEESSVQVPAPEPEQEPELSADEPKKRVRRSRFDQPDERKRKHSPSPSGDGFQSGYYDAPPKIPKQDDEPSFDDNSVILSWYDSDLNLTINKENFVSAVPLYDQGFMYMWSGVRSTYGFKSGKVYYDVKLMEKCPVNVYDDFEIYSFRLGWSVAYSSLQLGETSLSFGYDSSGKKCTNDTFEEYGQPFNAEDVIGCLVDFESHEENVQISFTFNGVKQDIAFEVPKASLEDKALFPHILSKNIGFEVNFGDRAEPWNTDENFKDEFEWASKVQSELRVTGPRKAESKSDCEVIMVCGLPCSGKTTWVKNHVDSHPEKMYNIIGIDAALNRMKVLNEPIQNYYKDAPDMLVEKCTKCINRLIDLGSIRWRNYILDQTNVLPQVQRRKMRNFDGYNRIAIVIIPSEEEYERYLEKWNDNTLRDSSVSLLELKGNFKLPEEGELFNSVSFVGVEKDQAEEIVRKYNKEGRDARPRDERPYNRGYGGRDHMDRMPSYGRPPMGGFRSGWMDRRPPPGMGRGGWGPRGGMDRMPPGFRDRRNWRDRSPDDDRDGNFRGRYQQRGMPGGRYGNGGPMMGNNRNWGAGRDRDRMGPRIGGPPGPNPLLAPMMGKPMMGYGPGERKGRFGSDDGKRRDDGDSDEFDRTGRVNPPGVDEDVEEPFDEGSGGEDGERKRRSRFSDTDRKDGPGGYRGRGGFQRGGNGGRGRGNGRPAPFPPGKPPRGGGGYNRGRGPDSGADYYGGRGGGQPRRDSRDRNQMGQRQGSSRFDKRDSGGKSDMNSQMSNPPPGWAMYGQGGWNQAAASHYQNWAQYQQGYNAQQMQQYWSQVQQQAQQGQQNQQSQHSGQQITKSGSNNSATNASSSTPTTSQTTSNSSQQQLSTSSAGYNTQGYNTAGYSGQGYDANAYAQYCAQYYQLAQQQGWTQNAWAAYNYNYGAMAASTGNVGGLPSTSVPPPSVTGGAGGASGGNSSGNQSSAVTSGSNK